MGDWVEPLVAFVSETSVSRSEMAPVSRMCRALRFHDAVQTSLFLRTSRASQTGLFTPVVVGGCGLGKRHFRSWFIGHGEHRINRIDTYRVCRESLR